MTALSIPHFHVITLKNTETEEEITLKVNWDTDLDGWKEQFKTILIWLSFHPETVNEAFKEEE